jgi:hypothetical protein
MSAILVPVAKDREIASSLRNESKNLLADHNVSEMLACLDNDFQSHIALEGGIAKQLRLS